jgi:hypothetical protein
MFTSPKKEEKSSSRSGRGKVGSNSRCRCLLGVSRGRNDSRARVTTRIWFGRSSPTRQTRYPTNLVIRRPFSSHFVSFKRIRIPLLVLTLMHKISSVKWLSNPTKNYWASFTKSYRPVPVGNSCRRGSDAATRSTMDVPTLSARPIPAHLAPEPARHPRHLRPGDAPPDRRADNLSSPRDLT